jgi:uncharacterized protein (TIGR02217 family)
MAFHEVQFPSDISYGSRGGPGFKTEVTALDSGAEQVVQKWSTPRRQYNVKYGIKNKSMISSLLAFYIARAGAANGFRFKDHTDFTTAADGRSAYAMTDVLIGVGDGATTSFQLKKLYTSGSQTGTRNITKIVSVASVPKALVAKAGVLASSGYTINVNTGILLFSTPPAAAVQVTAGFEFDVPVRFDEEADRLLSVSHDDFDIDSAESIMVVEIKDDTIPEEEFFYGGAYENAIAANFTTSVSLGRVQIFNPTVGSLSVTLPAKAGLPAGGPYFYITNSNGTNALAIKDEGGSTIVTLAAGQACEVVLSVDAASTKIWYAI